MKVIKVVTVNRTPAEAYALWRNFEGLPRFMRHLESVQVTENGRSRWRAKAPRDKVVEWEAEIVEDRPNELISWRSVEGSEIRNSGQVRFTPATGGRGTWVQVHLEYDPPAGALGAIVAKFYGEEPEQQVDDDLRAFKQILEIGEVTLSEATLTGNRGSQRPAQPPETWPMATEPHDSAPAALHQQGALR